MPPPSAVLQVATHAAVELRADKLLVITGQDVRTLGLPHYLPLVREFLSEVAVFFPVYVDGHLGRTCARSACPTTCRWCARLLLALVQGRLLCFGGRGGGASADRCSLLMILLPAHDQLPAACCLLPADEQLPHHLPPRTMPKT